MSQRCSVCTQLCVAAFLVVTGCGHQSRVTSRNTNGGIEVPVIPEPTYRNWSDPTAWPDGQKPVAGQDVTIPEGAAILIDEQLPELGGITIEGTLAVDDSRDYTLDAKWIMVHGRLRIGTPSRPFTHHIEITLTDDATSTDVMGMGTRGLMVMGGTLELVGLTPIPAWTHLGAHAGAGARSLVLAEATDWRAGDRIAIAPTDLYRHGHTETFELASAGGSSVGLSQALAKSRFGEIQTFGGATVDERAEVANLSRNIVLQGRDDGAWRGQRFGAHLMVMRGSLARIDGVELRRVGQAGRLGRYPIHFHRVSYADDGGALEDTQSFVRNVAVSGSANRCVVLHATNGVRVFNNVCHDITGHAFFLEDAVERRNVFEWNLAMGIHNPRPNETLLAHEGGICQGGSSGFWITNPDNELRRNVAADADGNGFWFSIPEHGLRASNNVPITPAYMPFGVFEDNAAHSNQGFGLNFDWVSSDDAGNVIPFRYQPFVDGQNSSDYSRRIDCVLERLTAYKNDLGALWNRVERLRMRGFVLADNPGTAFTGSSTNCSITGSTVVGTTANNERPLPEALLPSGAASYHSQCDITNNTFVNLPAIPGIPSGAFRTDDYYVRAVDRGLMRNHDNEFINSSPGWRSPMPGPSEKYALAGALWDPHGLWGPAGNFWVYDTPFLTYGSWCEAVSPAGQNGMSCPGPYYGVGQFVLDGWGDPFAPLMAIEVTRTDAGNAVFSVPDGDTAPKLGWMRHFAMRRGGSYALRFPTRPVPREVSVVVDSLLSPDDWALLGVQFQGALPARVYLTTWHNPGEAAWFTAGDYRMQFRRELSAAPDLATLSRSTGDWFYQDRSTNLVWIRVSGGLPMEYVPTSGSDEDLYHPVTLHVMSR
jgi:hypothetical protein